MLQLMNRRNFVQTLVGGIATAAAVRTFPFRVFSFPRQIRLETPEGILQQINRDLECASASEIREFFTALELCRLFQVPPALVLSPSALHRLQGLPPYRSITINKNGSPIGSITGEGILSPASASPQTLIPGDVLTFVAG
jgi:hypothetical protein